MRYKPKRQKRDNWCLPACLQEVIRLRRFMELSQREIASELDVNARGADIDLERLDDFLSRYDLKCFHYNPFMDVSMSPDIFLETELNFKQDVMAAYDFLKLHKRGRTSKEINARHFSIIERYNTRRDLIDLVDPSSKHGVRVKQAESFHLPDLVDAMQAREDMRYGFYVVF